MPGTLASVVTPFREDERIDFTAWQLILEMILAHGFTSILALGDEGEYRSLTEEERIVALRFCRQTLGRRATLYGNVGSDCTEKSVRMARAAEAEGVDVLVLTPPATRLSEVEQVMYLADVAGAVRIPVVESGQLGASGAANVAPKLVLELDAAKAAGREQDAERLAGTLEPLDLAFRLHTYPSAIKAAMALIGLPAGRCRRPVGELPASAGEALETILESLRSARMLPEFATRVSGL